MKRDILDFVKWLEELFFGFLALLVMPAFYVFFALWFLWKLIRQDIFGKPTEELSMEKACDMVFFIIFFPVTVPKWIFRKTKEAWYGKRSESLSCRR